MAKVLVTGGTGFVGRAVVGRLRALGFEVRLLSRSGRAGMALAARAGCEVIPGDIGDRAALERACQGVDAVVHLVGIIAEKGRQTFERVHVSGTEHVVRAAEHAGVKRYIHMSALGCRAEAPSRYHRTKWEAEEIVRRSSLAWTIFRPSVIFGPGDGFVSRLAAFLRPPFSWLQLHSFPLIGGGESLLQPVAVEDVAQAFAAAIAHAGAVGQTYDLAGPERLSLRAILEELARAGGQEFVIDRFQGRLLLRATLWLLVALLPVYLILLAVVFGSAASVDTYFGRSALYVGFGATLIPAVAFLALGAVVWLGLAALALRWRRLLFFPLPWTAAFAAGAVLQNLPNPPLTVSQVQMLRDDNVGDPAPAVAAFGLAQRDFRSGIRRTP